MSRLGHVARYRDVDPVIEVYFSSLFFALFLQLQLSRADRDQVRFFRCRQRWMPISLEGFNSRKMTLALEQVFVLPSDKATAQVIKLYVIGVAASII